jgi:type I restriction enzyme S subunit
LEQKQQQKKWLMQKLLEVSYAGADVEEKFSLGGVVIDKRRWKKEILGNVTTYSCVRKKDLESSYICTENMKPDFGGISFYKTSEFIDGVCYEKGDILLGNIRPYLRKAWMADRDGVCSPDVLVLKMTDKVFSDFLYNVIANEKFLKYVMKGVKGTKMPRGDKEHVMKYVFYLPSLPEQKIIAQVLSTADKEIALLKSSIEQEKQKKKSLAQLLLTGTVRVKI